MSRPKRRSTSRPYMKRISKNSCRYRKMGTHLHDGEGAWQVKIRQFDLSTVDSSQDFCGADSTCNTRESLVYKSHNPWWNEGSGGWHSVTSNLHVLTHMILHIRDSLERRGSCSITTSRGIIEYLLIVCWAPLSTNAITGLAFTSTGILRPSARRPKNRQS